MTSSMYKYISTYKSILYIIFLFFIIYSLFFNADIIEGLDSNDPLYVSKMNTSDIQTLKKQVEELKSVDNDINAIDVLSKQNAEDISKLSAKATQMKASMTSKIK